MLKIRKLRKRLVEFSLEYPVRWIFQNVCFAIRSFREQCKSRFNYLYTFRCSLSVPLTSGGTVRCTSERDQSRQVSYWGQIRRTRNLFLSSSSFLPNFLVLFRSAQFRARERNRVCRLVWQRIKLLYKNVKGFANENRFRGSRIGGGKGGERMWARFARWNRGIANAIGSLIVSKSRGGGGVRRVETRDPDERV